MKSDRRTFIGSLASLGALAACNGSDTMPTAGLKAALPQAISFDHE